MIFSIKGFSVDNEAAVDFFFFFWNSLAFYYDPTDVGNLISVFSAFPKPRLYIWKFSVHILLKPSRKDFEHYLANMWNKNTCGVVWHVYMLCAVLSCFRCVWLFATQWTVTHQVPLYMGFSKQEYWRGLLSPSPGDVPDSGNEPASLMSPALVGGSLPLAPPLLQYHVSIFLKP